MKKKNIDARRDDINDAMELLMKAGHWKFIDGIFEDLIFRVWRTDIDILLGYATISLPSKRKIPHRKFFMAECRLRYPDEKLWKGLD